MTDQFAVDQTDESLARENVVPVIPLNAGPGMVTPILSPGMLISPADPAYFDAWNYRPEVAGNPNDLAGFEVEASDGKIGKVDKASHSLNDGYLIVDLKPWIFGRTVVLPAGTVNHLDRLHGVVYLDPTKEQIKASPDVDVADGLDDAGRATLADYYGATYAHEE